MLTKNLFTFSRNSFQKRAYYADIKTWEIRPAEIISISQPEKQTTSIILASCQKGKLGPNFRPPEGLRHWLVGNTWQNLFKIQDNEIFVSNYCSWSPAIDGFLRSEEVEFMSSPEVYIYPKVLYSISPDIWREFLSYLDEDLVNALGLHKHRHLWMVYNYLIKGGFSMEQNINMAKLIASHHFLAFLFKANFEDLYSGFHAYTRTEWVKLRDNFRAFTHNLQQGELSLKKFQALHPAFSSVFLRKVAHCSSFDEVLQLAEAVAYYSSESTIYSPLFRGAPWVKTLGLTSNHKINAINWIPDSRDEPGAFSRAVRLNIQLQDYQKCLFFGSRKQWRDYDDNFLKNLNNTFIEDYLETLFDNLISRYLRLLAEEAGYTLLSINRYEIYSKFKQIVCSNCSINQIDVLQKRWHRHLEAIEAVKTDDLATTWKPLLADIIIDGIHIHALTSQSTLKFHGREMKHCVGDYVMRCLENRTNILVLQDENNLKSTLELRISNHQVIIVQHTSTRNQLPDASHVRVAKRLVQALNQGDIPMNQERLNQKSQDATTPQPVMSLETQEKVYAIYKARQLLPSLLVADSCEAMLAKIQLLHFIKAKINSHIKDNELQSLDRALN